VADTGDIDQIKKYKPTDATTNPSLLFKAAGQPQYQHLVDDAVQYGLKNGDEKSRLSLTMDRLAINFGKEITKIVPGVVSTEVDARLSFDEEATYKKAHQLINMYKEVGISKERILIKIASTWEGLKAAERLEKDGIHCNLTLLFSMAQAIVAANAKVTLISPFVGRISDWYLASTGKKSFSASEDPGVKSVTEIYNYYKSIGSKTVVMGASFRNKGQILALSGCDKLTISPELLEDLKKGSGTVVRLLKEEGKSDPSKAKKLDEKAFRWLLNEDAMATEKLAQGIRAFAADSVKLEKIISSKLKPSSKL
jgi:transaldolase